MYTLPDVQIPVLKAILQKFSHVYILKTFNTALYVIVNNKEIESNLNKKVVR